MKRMSECDSIYVLYVNRDKYDSPLYRIWSYTLAGLSAPHRWKTSKLLSFLQYYKFQLCCSLGNHYVEIINAVPLFNSQRKQGISQLPFLSETWVLSNCKVTISPCCLLSAPMVPYFETFFYQFFTAEGLQCKWMNLRHTAVMQFESKIKMLW